MVLKFFEFDDWAAKNRLRRQSVGQSEKSSLYSVRRLAFFLRDARFARAASKMGRCCMIRH